MSKKTFSQRQIQTLKRNPYVLSVTERSLRYTVAFKEFFITERENGTEVEEIFVKAGFDPKILGRIRMLSFAGRITNDAQRPEGFKDLRRGNSGRPRKVELTKAEKEEIEKRKRELRQQQIMAFTPTSASNLKAVQRFSRKKS